MPSKIENWKMSVEIDYLSMYIKTWFAFLATAKEMYPHAISQKGDGSLIGEYKNKLTLPRNYETDINNYIEEVFKLGEEIIKRDFPESYFGYYFILNKNFRAEIQKSLRTSSTKDENKNSVKDYVKINISFKEKLNNCKENNLYIKLTTNQKKFQIQLQSYLLDCNILIKDILFDEIYMDKDKVVLMIQEELQKVAFTKINAINGLDASKIEERKGYANGLIIPLIQDFRLEFRNELLFQPQPCKDFPYNYDKKANKLKILQWFIQFNYSLRNIMFHHVIDPFDEKWLKLFKNAYLALQEVVNHNITLINNKQEL